MLGVEDQKTRSFHSQKGSELGLLALLQLCVEKPGFIFSCCIISVQRLQCLWQPRGYSNLPTADCFLCTLNTFPTLGVLSLSAACWSVGSALCHAANPRKWSHLVAGAARHTLAQCLVGESLSKAVPRISLFFKLCPQCCSPSCQGFSSATGKMM